MHKHSLLFFVLSAFFFANCTKRDSDKLFELIPPEKSGIKFSNIISENDSINILKLEYIYNGGGVAIGDFNNDGLSDVFFTGNQVNNALYLNTNNLTFKDITEQSGVATSGKWKSGVALADVNQDGWLDIYVCTTIKKDTIFRGSMLFINQGLNDAGIPTFINKASEYGLADTGHNQFAAFLDYDKDGDLDVYLLANTLSGEGPAHYHEKINDGLSPTADKLYRNNGNNTFSNVSTQAGILEEGYGLGLAICDFNNDQWPDIYVSNDYLTNDILYINNQDGTFTNQIDKAIKHQSQFSMGNDVADINNDGLPDIITLDMLPEGNLRRKTVISGANYTSYINNEKFGYAPQHVRNMLQVNNGDGTFSEVGQLAGIYQTEWSWSPLFADFDNDGYLDLLVTNGFPKDVTDKDFGMYRSGPAGGVSSLKMMLDSIPVVKIPNYAFKNTGSLIFKDVTKDWGMELSSFSNGAAFADFDNDGDLEYITNNINEPPFLYKNNLYDKKENLVSNKFIRIKLEGQGKNRDGLGSKIWVYYDSGKIQYHDHSVYRGYLSTVENYVHFGLGNVIKVDSLKVLWPDNTTETLKSLEANKLFTLQQKNAHPSVEGSVKKNATLFSSALPKKNLVYKHAEMDKIDFNLQRTLPHKYSQYGPGLAVGDVNGDGIEDFYITGSSENQGTFFIQKKNGDFTRQNQTVNDLDREELSALLFDADNDQDLDLYTVTGSLEWNVGQKNYRDRFYKNDGKGNFKEDSTAIPNSRNSGSCARAADFDGDGDLDLFIAGRVIPAQYPLPPASVILINDKGRFTEATDQIAPGLKNIGMVTDALWSDFNNDGRMDLVIAGELMSLKFFQNNGNTLQNVTDKSGIGNFFGWWNSLSSGDFDRDGDVDYIAGNLGQNNFYHASVDRPVKVFAKDFDGNGSVDPITSCYFKMEDGSMQLCPVHFWEELNSQSPRFRRQFSRFKQYGKTTTEKLISPKDLEGALILEGNYSATSYVENLGDGKFKLTPLPLEAQFAPVFGIVADDFDKDDKQDVLLIGNDYGNEIFSGRADAFHGLMLKGKGNGTFDVVKNRDSGFDVRNDGKALVKLVGPNEELILASQNKDSLRSFIIPATEIIFEPDLLDVSAEIKYNDGHTEKKEFYYGSGFLSQSTRRIKIPNTVREIVIQDARKQKKTFSYTELQDRFKRFPRK